jgi:ankyrin repeat protein
MKFSLKKGLAYLGEYPLAWAACTANETIYNLLLDKGADPDAQDSFGNTVLHMVVVTNQMVNNLSVCPSLRPSVCPCVLVYLCEQLFKSPQKQFVY